jgi:hypothetical protein
MGDEGLPPYSHEHLFPGVPQSQLEVLQHFLPDEFFNEEIDAIQETFNLLPPATDPSFLSKVDSLVAGETAALDTVSRRLNQNLLDNYKDVLLAMDRISALNYQLNESIANIDASRKVLRRAEMEICDQPRVFFRQILKRRNLDTVLEVLGTVNTIARSTGYLNQALKDRDFKTALDLYGTHSTLGANVRRLAGVENLVLSLKNMYADVQHEMDTALVEQTVIFSREVYENLVYAYEYMNKLAMVPQKLQEAFLDRANSEFERVARSLADLKNPSKFRGVLSAVIDGACSILKVHQQIVGWHRGVAQFASVRRSVEDLAKTLWDNAEQHVTVVVNQAPLDGMSFEHFDRVLKAVARFLQFGGTVVDVPGAQLERVKEEITTRYFKLFHRGSIDAASQSVEGDTWEAVPSAADFERSILTLGIPVKDTGEGSGMTSISLPSAFAMDLGKTTNSCSSLLRMLHHYISLMKAVPALSAEAIRGIRELVEFYGFSVWFLFTFNAPLRLLEAGPKVIFRTECSTLFAPEGYQCLTRIIHHVQETQIPPPAPSGVATDPQTAVCQAALACENMRGVAWYLQSIRGTLEESLPENSSGAQTRFYSDMLAHFLMNFAQFVFPCYIPGLIALTDFDAELRAVKWNLAEALVEPHSFTETWSTAARQFAQIVDSLGLEQARKDDLWQAMWVYTGFLLINGFSVSSKCTMHGRTSMTTDFRSILHEFTVLTGKKIQVDSTWVSGFVQAFFKNPNDFKTWAQADYKKYTCAQILSIVDSGFADDINRQAKKDLRTFVQGLYKDQ